MGQSLGMVQDSCLEIAGKGWQDRFPWLPLEIPYCCTVKALGVRDDS